jgi:pimeloyl-ACP methyl ester carboxylesterase/DNA-binding CsgD family transcriptional regulator
LRQEGAVGSQRLRFVHSSDGVRIAWTESGQGQTTLVWAPNNYVSILEDADNPVRAPLLRELERHFRVVRYDSRGFGSSGRGAGRQSLSHWSCDLAAVMQAAQPTGPVALFGMSQGAAAAIAYAAKHPARVSRMMLHGAQPYGPGCSRSGAVRSYFDAMIEATGAVWSASSSPFRIWTNAGLLGDATPEEIAWYDAFLSRCASAEDAVHFMQGWKTMDARPLLGRVKAPTLVTHNTGDQMAPASLGRALAEAIPGSTYVELAGRSHVPRASDGTLQALIAEMVRFMGPVAATQSPTDLTSREHQVLDCLSRGLSNANIAAELSIADKTVRNHLSSIYDKLGVTSRTQAVVAALNELRA